eukprot:CAMPEP_0114007748 /NCGR_PEP_ID=MMETSP0372-20130328/5112_1 /TAXON_ID=340204 /ORGANISM="Lankesteria abbotti" /LENGTH=33 /assembly_acc=CAM_ASM_000359
MAVAPSTKNVANLRVTSATSPAMTIFGNLTHPD